MTHNLQDLFQTCDTRRQGLIGPPEFRELCANFGISPADADTIFADLDHDRDGTIDFNDFSHGFRDFLTPGSRRGSLQLPPHLTDSLHQMQLRHQSAQSAWKHFSSSVGVTNLRPFIEDTGQGLLSSGEGDAARGEREEKLEKALTALITDVHTLHEDYKTLETSFRKEKETHAAQLAALGEELDQQLAKTEAKAKAEARQEAQRQMEAERRKIAMEMEAQMADLGKQLRTFQKVEEWLTEEEKRSGPPSLGASSPVDPSKLVEAESENRSLKSALVEAQMKAALLQSQLMQKRNEYQELVNEFHTEKMAACEYKTQVDLMQNHLSILSQANRVLSDANDCFSMTSPPSSSTNAQPVVFLCSSDKESGRGDSGHGTLGEELRAEEGSSPLPSGVWEMPSKRVGGSGEEDIPHRAFKVILAGDAAVGKTTFIERVCQGHFAPNLSSTIGVDFRVKTLELEGVRVALQLWDTAGQERFRSLTKSYFRRADGVLLMYDVTNEATFLSIRHWAQNVEEGAGRQLPIVLCGNKSDLRSSASSSVVSPGDGAKLAALCGAHFIETSPKSGENVLEALLLLAREMREVEDLEVRNSMRLEEAEAKNKRGCCS